MFQLGVCLMLMCVCVCDLRSDLVDLSDFLKMFVSFRVFGFLWLIVVLIRVSV